MKCYNKVYALVSVLVIVCLLSVSCGKPEPEEVPEMATVPEEVESEEAESEEDVEPVSEPEDVQLEEEPEGDPESVDLELIAGGVPDEYLEQPQDYVNTEEYVEPEPEYVEPEYVEPDSEYVEEVYESTEEGIASDGLGADEATYYNAYTPYDLMYHGVLYWGGWRWTWYSENVLPGPGLKIPGRWSDGDFVRDADGCICLASSDLAWGTYVDTPWGLGRVYDSGCASGTLDVYVSW